MSNLFPALPTTYRGSSVMPYMPNGDVDRAHEWDWTGRQDTIASGLTKASVDPTAGTETFSLAYSGLTRADARAIESFVETQKARKTGFWCPTFQSDFYVTSTSGDFLFIREWGYVANIYPLGDAYSHFAAYRPQSGGSSNWGMARFASFVDSGTDAAGYPLTRYFVNAITYSGNTNVWGGGVNGAADGLVVMRMPFVRFADDALTTEWAHPNLASITLRVTTIPGETP